jgi:hypothetical protein
MSTSEPTLANLVVTKPSTLKTLTEPETVSASFGATEVAITGCIDMHIKIAAIINAERFMLIPN